MLDVSHFSSADPKPQVADRSVETQKIPICDVDQSKFLVFFWLVFDGPRAQDYLKDGPPGAFNGQPDSQKLKKLVQHKAVTQRCQCGFTGIPLKQWRHICPWKSGKKYDIYII